MCARARTRNIKPAWKIGHYLLQCKNYHGRIIDVDALHHEEYVQRVSAANILYVSCYVLACSCRVGAPAMYFLVAETKCLSYA